MMLSERFLRYHVASIASIGVLVVTIGVYQIMYGMNGEGAVTLKTGFDLLWDAFQQAMVWQL